MKIFNNILIVRTDRIGDVVLTTASIKAVRQAYPKAKITLLIAPMTKGIVENNPYIDEVIVDDRTKEHKGMFGFWKLANLLRSRKFDLAIIYHTKKRVNALCFAAAIPYRLGYKNDKFGFLLTHQVKDVRPEGKKHEAEYCLDLLKEIGIYSNDLSLYVGVNPNAERWAEEFLYKNNIGKDERLILISPGASDPSRCWPVHRFVELIQDLQNYRAGRMIIVGGPDVVVIAEKILANIKEKALVSHIAGQTNMAQFISLLKRSQLLISNDSGPVHLAAGLNIPVVSIFVRNQPGINPERWRPLGAKSVTVSVPFDKQPSFTKAGTADVSYLEKITVKQVLEAVDSLYKLC